jgi:hypothetical protein
VLFFVYQNLCSHDPYHAPPISELAYGCLVLPGTCWLEAVSSVLAAS